jgi:multiple sugar transport system ATP-binding protein
MAEIRVQGIRKSFGPLQLFDDFSLTCPNRTYLCLLGPSGCGKTTLMRMIAGLEDPDRGDVLIGGERVNDLAPGQRNVGLAFQNYALYPHLTVAGNLAFPLRAPMRRHRHDESDIARRVKTIAALLKIEPFLQRGVNQLSGGQQQRVALGRALIHDPRVLLLDEPVTHLDARLRHEMRVEIRLLHNRLGTTTIHITHDQQEALAMADVIAVIREGKLEQVGRPLELYYRPATAFVAGFIGDPPMSLVAASVTERDGDCALRIGEALLPLPETVRHDVRGAKVTEVLVGVRPRDVTLCEPGDSAIAASIYAHEMVGREQQMMLEIGTGLLRWRSEQKRPMAVGAAVGVRLSLERAQLFDRASGRNLSLRAAGPASAA